MTIRYNIIEIIQLLSYYAMEKNNITWYEKFIKKFNSLKIVNHIYEYE